MVDNKDTWRRFQRLKFDSKKIATNARRAEGVTLRHARKFIVRRVDNMREVQRHIVIWLLVVGALIVSAGVQLIVVQDSYTTQTIGDGGTYAEASLGPIDTLNPLYASSPAELAVSSLVFSSLYDYDSSGVLKEDIATATSSNKDDDIYTVTLASNVRWHDGTKLTAQDVVFTLDLIKNVETRSRLRTSWQDISVTQIDDYTIQFGLPSAYSAFPHALTFPILPRHILKDTAPGALRESLFSLQPVGSGPFEFRLLQTVSSSPVHKIVSLKASDTFYRGTAKLNRFEVHSYESGDVMASALRTGEVNATVDAAVTKDSDDDKFDVSSHPINSGVYALFNTTQPALKDKAVRRALQLGVDTTAIRQKFELLPPALDLPFIHSQVEGKLPKPQPYNFKKAMTLLDKAGWKMVDGVRKKRSQTLTLSVATTKDEEYEQTLEQLSGQWRKLGIDVQTTVIDTNDPSQNFVQNILQPRNFDVLIYELTIGADPDVYAYWHSTQTTRNGLNFSNYRSGLADDALLSARFRSESNLRDLKYITFAKQWLDDVPAIGLYQSTMKYAHTKNVQSLKDQQGFVSAQDRFADVLYWGVGDKSVYNTP